MSDASNNAFTVLALEHHILKMYTAKSGLTRVQRRNPLPQWLKSTIRHKQQNEGRYELNEENLALLWLTIFLTIFLLFSTVEI